MGKLTDESWDKENPAAAAAAGYSGVIGYVSQDTTGKNLTPADVARIHAAGMSIGIVYEFDPLLPLRGGAGGREGAAIAVSHALALQAPSRVCLYSAADHNFTADELPTVLEYAVWDQRVKGESGYRAGIYGGYDTIAYLVDHGYTGLLWQTYAWSRGWWHPKANIRQEQNNVHIFGATVDLDESMTVDWGQWDPPAVKPPAQRGDDLVDHWHTVENGSKGDAVRVAQGLLLARGYGVGSGNGLPDGDFGPTTTASTRAVQHRYGIEVDGIFGPHTASVCLYGVDVA